MCVSEIANSIAMINDNVDYFFLSADCKLHSAVKIITITTFTKCYNLSIIKEHWLAESRIILRSYLRMLTLAFAMYM
jgi:hypothetical protein